MQLYTIGHSAHKIEKFIELLNAFQIEQLIDVRSAPASRWHPQYNKHALQKVMLENHISYWFAGQQLGGRPQDPTCYDPEALVKQNGQHPQANFSEIMQRSWFIEGINTLVKQIQNQKTAILCSEEDPWRCHRHGLIESYMRAAYPHIEVQHIRGNGTLESAQEIFEAGEKQAPEQLSFL